MSEWIIIHENWERPIFRTYSGTRNKPLEGDILRCGQPDNIPDFRVTKQKFEAVVKVCQMNYNLPIFWAGDEKMLGHWANRSANIPTISDKSRESSEWTWWRCQPVSSRPIRAISQFSFFPKHRIRQINLGGLCKSLFVNCASVFLYLWNEHLGISRVGRVPKRFLQKPGAKKGARKGSVDFFTTVNYYCACCGG